MHSTQKLLGTRVKYMTWKRFDSRCHYSIWTQIEVKINYSHIIPTYNIRNWPRLHRGEQAPTVQHTYFDSMNFFKDVSFPATWWNSLYDNFAQILMTDTPVIKLPSYYVLDVVLPNTLWMILAANNKHLIKIVTETFFVVNPVLVGFEVKNPLKKYKNWKKDKWSRGKYLCATCLI